MFNLTDVDGIDQNVVYAPTAPVPIWPKFIYGALYLTETIYFCRRPAEFPTLW